MSYLWILIGTFFLPSLKEYETLLEHTPKNDIVIEISMEAGKAILLTYWDDLNRTQKLEFKNSSNNDSLVFKHISLNRPTQFIRGIVTKSLATNKYVARTDNYLLLPGDTLQLKATGNDLKQLYHSGGSIRLDEIFWMPSTFDQEFDQYEQYKRTGFVPGFDPFKTNTLQRIKDSSEKSMALVTSLYSQRGLTNKYYNELKKFNLLNIYNSIIVYSTIYPDLTAVYMEMYNRINEWDGINSRMNKGIMEFVFKYLSKSSNDTSGKWNVFINLPDSIKTKSAIQHHLLSKLSIDKVLKDRDSLKAQLKILAKAGFQNQLFTDYYKEYLIAENLKNSTEASLVTLQGDSASLRFKMASLKGKYVFVDIWASWCMPCFGQMPYLQKVKEELKNENITFLSISADNEEQHTAWLAAAKKESMDNKDNDFRFRKGFKNTYLEVNKITSIPRYMLFNTNGEVIDSDFIQPSNLKFKEQLLSYLKK